MSRGVPALISRWPAALVRNLAPRQLRGRRVDPGRRDDPAGTSHAGHAPDHFCFLDEARGCVLWRPREAGRDDRHTRERRRQPGSVSHSLRRIRALSPRRLLPGHGPVIDDPVTLIDEYLEHRVEREAQVLDAAALGRVVGRRPGPAHLHEPASHRGARSRRQRARTPRQAPRRRPGDGTGRGMARHDDPEAR